MNTLLPLKFLSYRILYVMALIFASPIMAEAGIIVYGTRVIFPEDKKEIIVRVENTSDTDPTLVQAWVDRSKGISVFDDNNLSSVFLVSPPLARIEPKSTQVFKIIKIPSAAGSLSKENESLFHFNVLEVPAKVAEIEKTNTLQFAIRTKLKLFYRPNVLDDKIDDIASKVIFSSKLDNSKIGSVLLNIKNPSGYYLNFGSIKFNVNNEWYELDSVTVPPQEEMSLNAKRSEDQSFSGFGPEKVEYTTNEVAFQLISDAGGLLSNRKPLTLN